MKSTSHLTKISRSFADELTTVEVDTYLDDRRMDVDRDTLSLVQYGDPIFTDRDEDREELCIVLSCPVKKTKNDIWFMLTEGTARYFAHGLGGFNHEDVWRANGQYGFIRCAKRIIAQINRAYPEIDTCQIEGRLAD